MPGPLVQLASSPTNRDIDRLIADLTNAGWSFELKFDGIRAVIERTALGGVTIYNRRQVDITYRYPDVVALVARLSFTGIIDTEIIVNDASGKPSFELAHLRDAQSRPGAIAQLASVHPATFRAFDILELDGQDVRALPYATRRLKLVRLAPDPLISASYTDGARMWAFVQEYALEGLIAKRPDAAYRPGRQPSWVKLKSTHRISALVGGFTPGKGSRGAIGALELFLWDEAGGHLVAIGSVGSGISAANMRALEAKLESGGPLVVEVEYLEVSSAGSLRMPVFKAIRDDVDPASCTMATLI